MLTFFASLPIIVFLSALRFPRLAPSLPRAPTTSNFPLLDHHHFLPPRSCWDRAALAFALSLSLPLPVSPSLALSRPPSSLFCFALALLRAKKKNTRILEKTRMKKTSGATPGPVGSPPTARPTPVASAAPSTPSGLSGLNPGDARHTISAIRRSGGRSSGNQASLLCWLRVSRVLLASMGVAGFLGCDLSGSDGPRNWPLQSLDTVVVLVSTVFGPTPLGVARRALVVTQFVELWRPWVMTAFGSEPAGGLHGSWFL